ncbi:hypothetical protein [Dechloromonas denitrificans]|uniref:hypothetical protein n=1 Tax=Dechloromonas denitrificans TaxID=281362 RepID=UPI001CF86CB5|nr:hypothetical protein [Dechloromonas denitrificans]UCV05678.1 hypothetical protein KI611_10675 [Dechloromonas denitrificans]
MKRGIATLAVVTTTLLVGCANIKLVSDYDEVVDKGITEFSEQFNTHMKNMAELGGKQEGTYDATFRTYNALDSKLDILIARASAASEGNACKLETRVFQKISVILKSKAPLDLLQGSDATASTESACNARLLILVKEQLSSIREIHKDSDKCKGISCIRAATAKDAMAITNQSITAVSVVEAAKKSQ